MSNTLEILNVMIQLTQLAANMNLSMQDLVTAQQQAEAEGREFGEQDLQALREKVEANLASLEQL